MKLNNVSKIEQCHTLIKKTNLTYRNAERIILDFNQIYVNIRKNE